MTQCRVDRDASLIRQVTAPSMLFADRDAMTDQAGGAVFYFEGFGGIAPHVFFYVRDLSRSVIASFATESIQ